MKWKWKESREIPGCDCSRGWARGGRALRGQGSMRISGLEVPIAGWSGNRRLALGLQGYRDWQDKV